MLEPDARSPGVVLVAPGRGAIGVWDCAKGSFMGTSAPCLWRQLRDKGRRDREADLIRIGGRQGDFERVTISGFGRPP